MLHAGYYSFVLSHVVLQGCYFNLLFADDLKSHLEFSLLDESHGLQNDLSNVYELVRSPEAILRITKSSDNTTNNLFSFTQK